jgi:hypothetical protein
MKYVIVILLSLPLLLSYAEAIADVKKIVCKQNIELRQGTIVVVKVTEFVLDTDDFQKENPYAEATLIKATENEVDYAIKYFNLEPTIGETYRLPFSVTPTMISVKYKSQNSPESFRTLDINRKDLTIEGFDGGKCEISDYEVVNAI